MCTSDGYWYCLRQYLDTVRKVQRDYTCLVCESKAMHDSAQKALIYCDYCGIRISYEMLYREHENGVESEQALVSYLRSSWQKRKGAVEQVGFLFLVDVLKKHGINIEIAKPQPWLSMQAVMNEVYAKKIEEQLKANLLDKIIGASKEKPWTYEDKASVEFDLAPPESGLL